jgi:hypothetical protein
MGDAIVAAIWAAVFVASGLVLRRAVPRLWGPVAAPGPERQRT